MVEELFLSCNGWLRSSSSDAMVDWRALPQLPWLIEELFLSCHGWLRSSSSVAMVGELFFGCNGWEALPQIQWLIDELFLSCNGWLRSTSSVAMVDWGALQLQWLSFEFPSVAMVEELFFGCNGWEALPQMQWLIEELFLSCNGWLWSSFRPKSATIDTMLLLYPYPLSQNASRNESWIMTHNHDACIAARCSHCRVGYKTGSIFV